MKFWLSVCAVFITLIAWAVLSDETLGERISSNIMTMKSPTAYASSRTDSEMSFTPPTVHQKINGLLGEYKDCQPGQFFLKKQRQSYAEGVINESVNRQLSQSVKKACR